MTRKPILMDVPMPIVTPRLVIDIAGPGMGAEIFEAVEETRDQLALWMSWEKDSKSEDACEEEVRRAYARAILREEFRMIARERQTGKAVVFTGLHNPKWDIPQVEIGYWVRASAQGQGFATETSNALIRYAFNALGARRIVIGHAEGNEKSRAVIERLGMTFECQRKLAHALPGDRVVDDFCYVRFDAEGLPALDVKWGREVSP